MNGVSIRVAKTAGCCFGVARAVKTVEELLAAGEPTATLGPLIHNPGFIADLQRRGVRVVETPEQTPPGCRLAVRTHGVPREVSERIAALGLPAVDVTCPFVKKIHRIAEERSLAGDLILIAGDENHPEVIGIRSYARTASFVVDSADALVRLADSGAIPPDAAVSLVSQTTFSEKEFKKIEKKAKKLYTNLKIFDTICNATALRQAEALAMSGENDMMLVIGGRNSSNTRKLCELCAEKTRTCLIEDAAELSAIQFKGVRSIGVTAGASTPDGTIKEVVKTMSEMIDNIETVAEAAGQADVIADPEEMSPEQFEQMIDEDASKRLTNEQIVDGVVLRITATEIQVDIGRKQTGIVPLTEYSYDVNADPAAELKVGDVIKLKIMKTNDAEGTILCSKKRADFMKNWEKIEAAYANKEILEGTVGEVNNHGLIVYVYDTRIFVPARESSVPRDGRLEDMLNKTVKLVLIDIDRKSNRGGRGAVGSVSRANRILRAEAQAKFWEQAEEGQHYTGTVKSLTDYGAFVELTPGVDGMIHRTELSWKRIKHPSDVVNVGDVVDVYIKGLDREKKKISLGYKKLEDNPWEILKRDYPVGSVVPVRIVRLATFGAFAEIFPRIEGLIHISQIANERIEKPQDAISIGDEVQAKILDIDFDKKRISLSIKALLPQPERKPREEEAPADDEPVVMSIDDMIAAANEQAAAGETPADE